jgi:enoyl-CoA hydratase/carnithine racemase
LNNNNIKMATTTNYVTDPNADCVATFPSKNVVLLTLNRPKARNAIGGTMGQDLQRNLMEASKDANVAAVIVTGNPAGKAFCAGADLNPATSGFAGSKNNKSAKAKTVPTLASYRDGGGYTSLAAINCTKPIICAVNGAAVGWGMAFPLACDIRIGNENAKVGFPMAARGLVNESCSSYLLPRIVGPGVAKELVFTGRVFRARDSPPGLFNYVLPEDQVMPKALELANEIAATTSTMSVAMCKFLMDSSWESGTPEQAMLEESKCLYWVNYERTDDVKEGISSFLQKRPAEWKHDAWDDLPDFLPFKPKVDVHEGRKRRLKSKM